MQSFRRFPHSFPLSEWNKTAWEMLAPRWAPVADPPGSQLTSCEVWSSGGALGTAARSLLAAAQH